MNDHGHQQIIIIKRGNEEEEGHHGGAWKIAFADFMTAMMALFLVLWLINAANEETKRAVASYFNPIKLVDRNRSVKGVEELKGGPTANEEAGGATNPEKEASEEALTTTSVKSETPSEEGQSGKDKDEAFFADPMAALDQIEASVLEKQGISNKIDNKGEDAMPGKFTDPFNSGFWQKEPDVKEDTATKTADGEKADGVEKRPREQMDSQPPLASERAEGSKEANLKAEAANLEKAILQEIEDKLGEETSAAEAINVKQTDSGILIQITDTQETPMFDIGAAVPKGETVIAVNAVAKALSGRPGPVHVYGHTDARKFDGPGNGNWGLSLDRAQSVYFILLRAGLAESRFAEVSGFADRKPVAVGDPLADQNRRIEIFLEQT